MTCDLEDIFGALAKQIMLSDVSETYTLSSLNIPAAPATLRTDQLVIKREYHDYLECYRADLLTMAAEPKTYASLALLVLSTLFHESPVSVDLHLTSPGSDIDMLSVTYLNRGNHNGYTRSPSSFSYSREDVVDIPALIPHDLPCFYLCSYSESALTTVQDWENRRVVKGFGRDTGCAYLANILLKISEGLADDYEYRFEGIAGNGRTGPLSAECRVLLPGHRYWDLYVPTR